MSNYTMNKKTNYMAVSAAAILVTAFVLVNPMQASSQVTFEGIPSFQTCFLDGEQPEDPLSMTTVVGKSNVNSKIAKTVHAEKQIFTCNTVQGNIEVIVDVTIYAEIYENMTFPSGEPPTDPIHKEVQVITCVKLEDEARLVGCEAKDPVEIDDDLPVLVNCREEPIEHPQEMNTEAKGPNGASSGVVKTIESQKEVFRCDLDGPAGTTTLCPTTPLGRPGGNTTCRDDDKKVDLIIFTDIWEDLKNITHTPPDPTLAIDTMSLTCVIKIDEADVEACEYSAPDRIFP